MKDFFLLNSNACDSKKKMSLTIEIFLKTPSAADMMSQSGDIPQCDFTGVS